MPRRVAFPLALLVLGALVWWVAQTGGVPAPYGMRVGQGLSRAGHFLFLVFCGVRLVFGPLRAGEVRAWRVKWVVGAVALNFAVVESVKRIVFWPRPQDAGRTALTAIRDAGFPSGHTVPAFLFAALMGTVEPRLRLPALGMAILIGTSRVQVGAHFAAQVWLSAVIGLVLASLWAGLAPSRAARV